MVTKKRPLIKAKPEYPLEGVHRLATRLRVQYMHSRLLRHVSNLGMRIEQVCAQLGELREANFQRSESYDNDPRWHDVYVLPHPVTSNPDERLYIKFRVSGDWLWIELCSFHPEGWI